MSLYKAETRRLFKRRFARYLVLVGVLVLGAVAVGMLFTNQKVSPAVVAKAEAQAEADFQRGLAETERYRSDCESAATSGTATNKGFPADCSEIVPMTRDQYQADWYMPSTFNFRENFGYMLTTLAAILALIAFVVGASFVGAEWSSGGMMNLLLWRPQRVRVLTTKLAAFLIGLTTLTVIIGGLWTATFWLIATTRGTTDKMTSGAWQSFALTGLRGLGLVLAVGAIGFALASLGRHTAMAFGVAIGVAVIFQFGLGAVLAMARVPFMEAYLIPVWGAAWMQKTVTLENWDVCNTSSYSGNCEPATLDITWQMAGGVGGLVLVLVVVAALWTMRSRDVT